MTAPDTSTQVSPLSAIKYAAGTDIGKRREENQDSFGIIENDHFRIFIVADGMGGVKGGAVASALAIKVMEEELKNKEELNSDIIKEAVAKANSAIFDRGAQDQGLAGMGTTLVGVAFVGLRVYLINVGDSRLYRVRGGRIKQLSEDHTLVRELLKTGAITPDQAENHPVAHMLTRSLGPTPSVEIDCWLCDDGPARDDIYILCSDGLYNLVNERDVLQLLREHSIDESIQRAINLANERGGTDNITSIVVRVGESYPVGPEEFPEVEDSIGLEDTVELYISRDQLPDAVSEHETNGVDPAAVAADSAGHGAQQQEAEEGASPKIEGQIEIDKITVREAPAAQEPPQAELQPELPKAQPSNLKRRLETAAFIALAMLIGFFGRDWWIKSHSDQESSLANTVVLPPKPEGYSEVIAPVQKNLDLAAEKPALRVIEEQNHLRGLVPPLEAVGLGEIESNLAGASDSSLYHGLTRPELEEVSHRRDELNKVFSSLEEKMRALETRSFSALGDRLKEVSKERSDLRYKMEQLQQEIDATSRKLAVWYGRQKRLQTSDPIDLAAEVAVTSDPVQEKKRIFEQATWSYLQELEVLKYNPTDAAQEQKVKNLLKLRKERLSELATSVKDAIDKEARETDHDIAKLTLERDASKDKLAALEREVSDLQILTGKDEKAKQVVRDELRKRREVVSAELQELNKLLPQ